MKQAEKIGAILRPIAEADRTFWLNEGRSKRSYLLSEGLPLETISTNTYRGRTWMGLYAYMEGMRGS